QKQDAFTSQAKINTDPFASFTPNFPSTANSSAVGKEDLFGNFPPKVTTSTTNVNMMMMTQPFPSVNSTMPSSSMFTHSSDTTHTLNPFANSSLGVQNSIGFNRIPNPFTSYPIVAASPNISQFGEPVSLPKSDSKNPFLPITQQSFSVNPFSNLTNPPSISYPQSTMNSFSPMIMHSVNSFPTKMDTPVVSGLFN
ncbi:unnamed protein product, partial [Trichobilharzia regenti]